MNVCHIHISVNNRQEKSFVLFSSTYAQLSCQITHKSTVTIPHMPVLSMFFSGILGGVDANANMDNWFVVVSWCNYVKYDKKGERSNRDRTINYFDMWLQKHDISWLVGDS